MKLLLAAYGGANDKKCKVSTSSYYLTGYGPKDSKLLTAYQNLSRFRIYEHIHMYFSCLIL